MPEIPETLADKAQDDQAPEAVAPGQPAVANAPEQEAASAAGKEAEIEGKSDDMAVKKEVEKKADAKAQADIGSQKDQPAPDEQPQPEGPGPQPEVAPLTPVKYHQDQGDGVEPIDYYGWVTSVYDDGGVSLLIASRSVVRSLGGPVYNGDEPGQWTAL